MRLLEEKRETVEDKKWWITELPMRRAWERIYIPLSACRLGNYLLILRRTASMVASLKLPIFLVFFFLRKSFWMSWRPWKGIPAGHLDPFRCPVAMESEMRIWTPLPARHKQLITRIQLCFWTRSTMWTAKKGKKALKNLCRQAAWAELSGKRKKEEILLHSAFI